MPSYRPGLTARPALDETGGQGSEPSLMRNTILIILDDLGYGKALRDRAGGHGRQVASRLNGGAFAEP